MLILNDGTELECTLFGLASVGILYIDIVGGTLTNMLEIFSDKNKTKRMTYKTQNEEVIRDGFTTILGVQLPSADSNTVRVSIRKPYADEV